MTRARRLPRWRPGRALDLPAHRASSATLAGAYPFLVPPAMDVGVPIGVDVVTGQPFCYDPWALCEAGVLTNPNVLLAGVIGQGKSAVAKSLAVRSVAAGRQVYVPGDPKGEWGIVADAVGGLTIRLGPGLPTRVNPLDVTGPARAGMLAAVSEILLGRALSPAEHAALDAALRAIGDGPAVLADVLRWLVDPDPRINDQDGISHEQRISDGRNLAHALRRLARADLAGLFDAPTTTLPDPDAAMVVLDLSALAGDDTALAVAMTVAGAWLDPAIGARGPRAPGPEAVGHLRRGLAPAADPGPAETDADSVEARPGHRNREPARRAPAQRPGRRRRHRDRQTAPSPKACSPTAPPASCTGRSPTSSTSSPGSSGWGRTESDVVRDLHRGTGLWRVGTSAHIVAHHLGPQELTVM